MANEQLSEEQKKQINKMEIFLKESFCIDGECSYIENINISSTLKPMQGNLFALSDSKRGVFYITMSK